MFDKGSGPPLIVVPGIQGRWEWLKPMLLELSTRHRTISYTLAGDFGAQTAYDPAQGFDNYLRQLDEVYERTGLASAALCGISYGGFIALRYAATRPQRVSSLILASSPSPGWAPNELQRRYVRRPWLSSPAFVATAPVRLAPEIYAAYDSWLARVKFAAVHTVRVVAAPMIPSVMARRVQVQQAMDFTPDCARVTAPTLVISGEEHLDRVVPVEATRRYETLIAGARYARMERTGHLGVLTRPERFAKIVDEFLKE